MYRLAAPSLPPGDDEYKGKFCVWNGLVAKEDVVSGLEPKIGQGNWKGIEYWNPL